MALTPSAALLLQKTRQQDLQIDYLLAPIWDQSPWELGQGCASSELAISIKALVDSSFLGFFTLDLQL